MWEKHKYNCNTCYEEGAHLKKAVSFAPGSSVWAVLELNLTIKTWMNGRNFGIGIYKCGVTRGTSASANESPHEADGHQWASGCVEKGQQQCLVINWMFMEFRCRHCLLFAYTLCVVAYWVTSVTSVTSVTFVTSVTDTRALPRPKSRHWGLTFCPALPYIDAFMLDVHCLCKCTWFCLRFSDKQNICFLANCTAQYTMITFAQNLDRLLTAEF